MNSNSPLLDQDMNRIANITILQGRDSIAGPAIDLTPDRIASLITSLMEDVLKLKNLNFLINKYC